MASRGAARGTFMALSSSAICCFAAARSRAVVAAIWSARSFADGHAQMEAETELGRLAENALEQHTRVARVRLPVEVAWGEHAHPSTRPSPWAHYSARTVRYSAPMRPRGRDQDGLGIGSLVPSCQEMMMKRGRPAWSLPWSQSCGKDGVWPSPT